MSRSRTGAPGSESSSARRVVRIDAVVNQRADSSLLDRYERRLRTVNIEFVQQQPVDNKKRLEEKIRLFGKRA